MSEDERREHPETLAKPNQALARRRGQRRGAGADTPSGPVTDRSPAPAKRDAERQQRAGTSAPFATSNEDWQQREAE